MLFKNFSRRIAKTDDYAKLLLWLPKLFLSCIYLWPEIPSNFKKMSVFIFLIIYFTTISCGILFYVKDNTFVMSSNGILTLSNILQAMSKTILIYFYANRIQNVIENIWNDFWPSNIDPHLQKFIERRYTLTLNGILTFIIATTIFVVGVIVGPLITERGKPLPYPTASPFFDCTASPQYEIIFFLEATCDILIPIIVLGYDFLFFSLCFTLTAQYMCLQHIIEKLGCEEMRGIIENIGFHRDEIPRSLEDAAKMFIKIFSKQHCILLKLTQEIEGIFTIAAFIQLFNSIMAMCISCLITTVDSTSIIQIFYLDSAAFAYFMQLLIYCAHGNELTYQSSILQDYIFGSNWYEINSDETKKEVLMLIKASRSSAKLTALKFFNMNYTTFIQVVRLSFSFFTLLSTVTN